MELKFTKHISHSEYEAVSQLFELCQNFDQLHLSCPETDSWFVLLYQNKELLSCFSMYISDDCICECMSITHPEHRRKGYFTQCLDRACSELDEYEETCENAVELCFLSDRQSNAAIATLEHIGAELWYEEYLMELSLDESFEAVLTPAYSTGSILPPVKLVSGADDTYYIKDLNDCSLGSFRLCETENYGFLYELEIQEAKRQKGFATSALLELCRLLKQNFRSELKLQVSGLNLPALNLYKKTGFRITETLSYYLY